MATAFYSLVWDTLDSLLSQTVYWHSGNGVLYHRMDKSVPAIYFKYKCYRYYNTYICLLNSYFTIANHRHDQTSISQNLAVYIFEVLSSFKNLLPTDPHPTFLKKKYFSPYFFFIVDTCTGKWIKCTKQIVTWKYLYYC